MKTELEQLADLEAEDSRVDALRKEFSGGNTKQAECEHELLVMQKMHAEVSNIVKNVFIASYLHSRSPDYFVSKKTLDGLFEFFGLKNT